MKKEILELKYFLDEEAERYEHPQFITEDPISIPHRFSLKQDVEIAAFFAASLAWGNRKSIIKSANGIMGRMDERPFDFIVNHSKKDLKVLDGVVHRTFNAEDCKFFCSALQHIYKNLESLEDAFISHYDGQDIRTAIMSFRAHFFNVKYPERSAKHVSNPMSGSSSKRLNMFLRWMVRSNAKQVDFGLWKKLNPSVLAMPLDVHTGNVARELKLLTRKQNDWTALEELMTVLRKMDAQDPVKYDFALFSIGVNAKK